MPTEYTLLVDDQDSQINYLCPTVKQVVAGSYSNNTYSTIKSSSCKDGWFQYSFYGTGIRVEIPTIHPSQDVSVTLDNAPVSLQSDGSFVSSVLPDGEHTLKYATGKVKNMPAFDYLTVTAGESTPLNGKTLIVDDTDTSVTYHGSWSTSPPKELKYGYSTPLYRDTAHWSSTVGDTIRYEFVGTSLSVYGLVVDTTSNITASYTIDGVTQSRGIPQGTFDSVPMTEFFHANDLAPGQHTLVVNLTDIKPSQAFGFDFIAYNSSVDSISSLPGYVPTVNAGTGEPTFERGTILSPGAIAGIVIGIILLLALLGTGLFFLWRTLRAKKGPVALHSNTTSYDDIEASKSAAQQAQMQQSEK